MKTSTKITYVILICLFIGAGLSYLFRHYVMKTPSQPTVQVQTAATENPSSTHYANNPVNPATGLPDKAEVLSTLPKGALLYQSATDTRPYGVLGKDTIVNLKKKVGSLYEIDYNNELLYIDGKDITFKLS